MPVLESPKVIAGYTYDREKYASSPETTPRLAGLTTYRQKPLRELPDLEIEEVTDFSGHLGFNPVINYASLNVPSAEIFTPENVTLHLRLTDAWTGKNRVLAEIHEALSVKVTHSEPSPYQGDKSVNLIVKGAENILKTAEYLRDKFEKSTRDDNAVYYRPIIHPALLGTIMDDIEQSITATQSKTTGHHPWRQAFLDYGWRG